VVTGGVLSPQINVITRLQPKLLLPVASTSCPVCELTSPRVDHSTRCPVRDLSSQRVGNPRVVQ